MTASSDLTSSDVAASVVPQPASARLAGTRQPQPRHSGLDSMHQSDLATPQSGAVMARRTSNASLTDSAVAAAAGNLGRANKPALRTSGLARSNSTGQVLDRLSADIHPESPATPRDGRGRPIRGTTAPDDTPRSSASSQLRNPRTSRDVLLSSSESGYRAGTADTSKPATPRSSLSQSKCGTISATRRGRTVAGSPACTPRRTLDRAAARSAQAAAEASAVSQVSASPRQRRPSVGVTPRRRSSQIGAQQGNSDAVVATDTGGSRAVPGSACGVANQKRPSAAGVAGSHSGHCQHTLGSNEPSMLSEANFEVDPEPSAATLDGLQGAQQAAAPPHQQSGPTEPHPDPGLEPPTPSPQPQPRVASRSTQPQQPVTSARVLQVSINSENKRAEILTIGRETMIYTSALLCTAGALFRADGLRAKRGAAVSDCLLLGIAGDQNPRCIHGKKPNLPHKQLQPQPSAQASDSTLGACQCVCIVAHREAHLAH